MGLQMNSKQLTPPEQSRPLRGQVFDPQRAFEQKSYHNVRKFHDDRMNVAVMLTHAGFR